MSTAQSALRRFMQQCEHVPGFISLRLVEQQSQSLVVIRNIIEPPAQRNECGVMVCVHVDGQQAFAATSDISQSGLRYALDRATQTAQALRGRGLLKYTTAYVQGVHAHYRSPNWTRRSPTLPSGWRC